MSQSENLEWEEEEGKGGKEGKKNKEDQAQSQECILINHGSSGWYRLGSNLFVAYELRLSEHCFGVTNSDKSAADLEHFYLALE